MPPSPVSTQLTVHISGLDPFRTPGVFYTYFYNNAHRIRLEKLKYLEPSRSPNGKTTSGLHGRFEIETDKNLTAIYLTGTPQQTQVSVRV